jgi:O-antigen/teichoic acid export membrane protein
MTAVPKSVSQKIIRSGGWSTAGKVFSSLSTFFVGIMVARILPQTDAGRYFYIIATINVLTIILQCGVGQTAIKRIGKPLAANETAVARVEAQSAIAILVCVFLLFMAFDAVVVRVSKLDGIISEVIAPLNIWTFTLTLYFSIAISVLSDVFRAFHNITVATLVSAGIPNMVLIGTLVLMSFFKIGDLFGLLLATFCAYAIALLYATREIRDNISRPRAGATEIRAFMRDAFPTWIISTVQIGVSLLNLWMVGSSTAPEIFAVYNVSYRTAVIFNFVTAILYSLMPAILVELYANKQMIGMERIIRSFTTINLLIITPIFILVCLFPKTIMTSLYGGSYSDSATLLILFSMTHLLNIVTSGLRGFLLCIHDCVRGQVFAVSAGAIATVSLTYISMRYQSLEMAALAAFIGTALQYGIETWYVRSELGILVTPYASLRTLYSVIESLMENGRK